MKFKEEVGSTFKGTSLIICEWLEMKFQRTKLFLFLLSQSTFVNKIVQTTEFAFTCVMSTWNKSKLVFIEEVPSQQIAEFTLKEVFFERGFNMQRGQKFESTSILFCVLANSIWLSTLNCECTIPRLAKFFIFYWSHYYKFLGWLSPQPLDLQKHWGWVGSKFLISSNFYYSVSRLMWSLWDRLKLITLTEW